MEKIVIIVHVLAALGIVGLILLQQGKGAEMGASFGAGASNTVFGSPGAGNILTKATSFFVLIFFLTSLGLAFVAKQHAMQSNTAGVPDDGVPSEQIGVLDAGGDVPTVDDEEAANDGDVPAISEPEATNDVPAVEETGGNAVESASGDEQQ